MAESETTNDVALSESDEPATAKNIRRAGLSLVLPAVTVLALASYSTSRFVAQVNADALLLPLISTQKLTFYYWGQDRLASLLPLLTFPIQDVRLNFYVQILIQAALFFFLIGLFVGYHQREAANSADLPSGPAPVSGEVAGPILLTSAAYLATTKDFIGYQFVLEQQYVISLVLYLLGLDCIMRGSRTRMLVGAALVLVAAFVIPATLLLAPLAFVMAGPHGRWARGASAIAISFVALTIASVAPRIFLDSAPGADAYSDFDVRRMADNLDVAWSLVIDSVSNTRAYIIAIAAVGVLVLTWRRRSQQALVACVAVVILAAAWTILFTANLWVSLNGFSARYYFPVYGAWLFLVAGASHTLWGQFGAFVSRIRLRGRQISSEATRRIAVAGIAITSAGLCVVGMSRLLTDEGVPVLAAAKPSAIVAQDLDVDFVVGSYWVVWPITFSSLTLGEDLPALTYRGQVFRSDVLSTLANDAPDDAGRVRLLCAGTSLEACPLDFSAFVFGDWVVDNIVRTTPLVIDVIERDT